MEKIIDMQSFVCNGVLLLVVVWVLFLIGGRGGGRAYNSRKPRGGQRSPVWGNYNNPPQPSISTEEIVNAEVVYIPPAVGADPAYARYQAANSQELQAAAMGWRLAHDGAIPTIGPRGAGTDIEIHMREDWRCLPKGEPSILIWQAPSVVEMPDRTGYYIGGGE